MRSTCSYLEKEEGPANRPSTQSTDVRQSDEERKDNEEAEKPHEPPEAVDYNAPEYWDEDKSPEGYTYYWNTVTGGKC